MGFSDILLVLAIALILFGPEDLPEIARKIGKVVFEIRKVTNDLTKEFQSSMNTPSSVLNKVLATPTSPRTINQESPHPSSEVQEISSNDEDLLTYDDEYVTTEKPSKGKTDDPLAELPLDMVSYEEKGASR